MKRTILLTIFFLSLTTSFSLFPNQNESSEIVEEYETYEGLLNLIEGGEIPYLLVDVRTAEEYERGHIPTALNIPVDTIEDNPPSGRKEDLIILYCRSGRRSGIARFLLSDMGYVNVFDFGSYKNWEDRLIEGDQPGHL